MFPRVYTYVKTYQIVHLKHIQLAVCHLYISKAVLKTHTGVKQQNTKNRDKILKVAGEKTDFS